jgi:phosphoglycerate dehydrogenase-like enzyme
VPTVAVSSSVADDVRKILDESAPPEASSIEFLVVGSGTDRPDLAKADAGLRWGIDNDEFQRLLDEAQGLRWLHSPGAGVEGWPLTDLAARNITLTNGAGVFAIPIAEWVLTSMLTIVKSTHAVRDAQRGHRWERDAPSDELYGKTMLLLGPGGIGREIITRASAFGMRIWAANRSGRSVDGADRTVHGDAWRDLLPDADFVVSTLPLTGETRGIIGAAELARFKPSAWLLNVGRGATIDEAALFDAVAAGTVGGAALDAWTQEPLPTDSPAWDLPNIIVSPHRSGSSAASTRRGLQLFTDNLVRFAANEPLMNVVDLAAGY